MYLFNKYMPFQNEKTSKNTFLDQHYLLKYKGLERNRTKDAFGQYPCKINS